MNRIIPAVCYVAFLFAAVTLKTAAADPPTAADDAATVRPLVGETTAMVVKIDPVRLALPELPDAIRASLAGSEAVYQEWTQAGGKAIALLRTATGGQPVYATLGVPLSRTEVPVFVFLRESPDVDQKRLTERLGNIRQELRICVRHGLIVANPIEGVDLPELLDAFVAAPRDELESAFQAVNGYPVQVLLLPPAYVRRTVVELMPELPRQLGGGPSGVLTDGLLWAALGLDPAAIRGELVIQSASPAAAGALAAHVPRLLTGVYKALPDFQKAIPAETFERLLTLTAPKVDGNRIVLRIDQFEPLGAALQLVTTAVAAFGDRTRRVAHMDHFQRIVLAMHQYHDRYGVFPPRDAERDGQGKPRLSWRVHLLPFLEQQALYDQFRLDEAWDSPHNKKLVDRMPDAYRSRWDGAAPGHTTFLAPAGDDTVLGGLTATRFRNITDGTSNTVVLVEVKPERAVPWTALEDYAFDPSEPARGLQIGADGRFLAVMADGSVHQMRGDGEAELLLRLFRKSDGRLVDWDKIR